DQRRSGNCYDHRCHCQVGQVYLPKVKRCSKRKIASPPDYPKLTAILSRPHAGSHYEEPCSEDVEGYRPTDLPSWSNATTVSMVCCVEHRCRCELHSVSVKVPKTDPDYLCLPNGNG